MNSTHGNHVDYVGEDIPEELRLVFIIVGIVYIIVGISGNTLIIVTIALTKAMRNPHYYFIINLAISDLILTGYILPWNVSSLILRYYPVVNFDHCIFNGFLAVAGYASSLLSLLAISLNRYLCICHNDLFKQLFSHKALSSFVGCGLIWFISILCTLPCVTGWGRFVFDRKGHYCCYDRTYSFSYTLFLLIFSIGVPVLLVFFCNFAIWRFVRQSRRRIHSFTGRHLETNESKPQSKKSSAMPIAGTSTSESVDQWNQINNDLQNANDLKIKSSGGNDLSPAKKYDSGLQHHESRPCPRKVNAPRVTPEELALIKTVFTVFLTFATLMSPYMISTLLDTEDKWPSAVHIGCAYTSFTNCCLNCFLYGLMTPRFKQAYRSVFSLMVDKTSITNTTSSDRTPQSQTRS